MIEIEKTNFLEKFTEINFRQRMYEGTSVITLITNIEFYPSLVNGSVVSGSIEAKVDIQDISSIDELVGKTYNGDIGKLTISVNNDGVWEHQTKEEFKFDVKSRDGRKLAFLIETDNCKIETSGVMVSLYTTSSKKDELSNNFKLDDFYDNPSIKEVGSSKIMKYFVKE